MRTFKDLKAHRFGRLIVKELDKERSKQHIYWICQCDCGNTKSVMGCHLTRGLTKSCGCLVKENTRNMFTTHGLTQHPLFEIWGSMKKRCYNPKTKAYKDYGGRGISVCDDWVSDFKSFYEWAIRTGYKEGLTIDRINVNGNYCPENCRWITLQEQARNRRNTVWVTYQGKQICKAEFARMIGISDSTVRRRIKKGMTGDEIAKEFNE